MRDNEQQLIEAATRYQELLDQGTVISVPEYVATVDPALREELASYLELVLAVGTLEPVAVLTRDEQMMADRAAIRMRERWKARAAPSAGPVPSLTQLRTERKQGLGAFARALNLPVDLLHRIERGGVDVATIPGQLVARIAAALERAEADIRSALATPTLAGGGVRLNAEDATATRAEVPVSFADALAESTATAAQRAEWSDRA